MAVASQGLPATGGPFARWRERVFRSAPADRGEVVLRHSRIYILPTRRGLPFIATIATMIVTSLNYGLALGFLVAFALAGLCPAALLHTFRNLAGLRVRPGAAGETFAGGSIPFTLHLDGDGRERSCGIVVETRDGTPAPLDVAGDANAQAVVEVAAPRRGRVALGRVTLSSDFPLGLWRGWDLRALSRRRTRVPGAGGRRAAPPGAAGRIRRARLAAPRRRRPRIAAPTTWCSMPPSRRASTIAFRKP